MKRVYLYVNCHAIIKIHTDKPSQKHYLKFINIGFEKRLKSKKIIYGIV